MQPDAGRCRGHDPSRRGRSARRGTPAARTGARPAARGRAPGRPAAAAGCRGARGAVVTWSASPASTISPVVHHRDAVADVPDDVEVVGDEEVGDAGALLDLHEQVQHAGLGGQVQGADRLVADDQLGVAGQGAGDGDALALAAGELPRQPARGVGGQVHLVQQVAHPLVRPSARGLPVHRAAARRGCRRPSSPGSARCTGPGRPPACRGSAPGARLRPGVAMSRPSKRMVPAGDRGQAEHGPAEGGLAGAGLPDQAEGLAGADARARRRQRPERLARGSPCRGTRRRGPRPRAGARSAGGHRLRSRGRGRLLLRLAAAVDGERGQRAACPRAMDASSIRVYSCCGSREELAAPAPSRRSGRPA